MQISQCNVYHLTFLIRAVQFGSAVNPLYKRSASHSLRTLLADPQAVVHQNPLSIYITFPGSKSLVQTQNMWPLSCSVVLEQPWHNGWATCILPVENSESLVASGRTSTKKCSRKVSHTTDMHIPALRWRREHKNNFLNWFLFSLKVLLYSCSVFTCTT